MTFERHGKAIGMRGDLKGYNEQSFVPMLHEETGGLVRSAGVNVFQDPALVSCWTFDEIRGNILFDHGPLGNHAIKTGAPAQVADGRSFDHTGSQYFTTNETMLLGVKDAYPEYSIVSWQYADSNYNSVYGQGGASSNEVFVMPDTNTVAWIMDDGVWRTSVYDAGLMAQDQWSCIIFSATGGDGNDWDAWYNGVPAKTKGIGGSNMRFDLNNFGYPYTSTGFAWHGIIRMIAVYSRRFNNVEAKSIFDAGMYRRGERSQYAI